MVFSSLLLSVLLLYYLFNHIVAFSYANRVIHCQLHDDFFEDICSMCENNFFLTQSATSCEQREDFRISMNCMQVSDFGECMRCHCGYVLSQMHGGCMIAPSSLIGCEIATAENICSRPKVDYLLLKTVDGQISLEFAKGTHCEIFDLSSDTCIQCHSGYKYIREYDQCQRSAQRVINEYFSFFSQDGELYSRSLQFTAQFNGVYPKIEDCQVYSRKQDSLVLECEKCNPGRTLNQSKTECLKSTVEFCKISKYNSESEGSITCLECIDNDNFFINVNEFNQQFCQPREQLDPTTKCLTFFQDNHNCQQCSKGLFLTEMGCSLEPLDLAESSYLFSQSTMDLHIIQQINRLSENCEYWLNESVCGSCKNGMIPNNKGTCQIFSDQNCLIAKENSSSCMKCISLMYFNEQHNKCIFIDKLDLCVYSLGESNTCEICVSLFYTTSNGDCEYIHIQSCSVSNGKEKICEICKNKFYLDEQSICSKITAFESCIISDGIINKCTKCYKYYLQDDKGNCIPQITAVQHQCLHPYFYIEEKQDRISFPTSDPIFCVEYSFLNFKQCFRFHPHKNECLECYSGYYISSGQCYKIADCLFSDGINNHCDQYGIIYYYLINSGIQFQIIKTCKDSIEKNCQMCLLDNSNLGFPVTEIIPESSSSGIIQQQDKCVSFSDIFTLDAFQQCLHLIFEDNKYKCALCLNLYYLNENKICTPFEEEIICEISDGISKNCMNCGKQQKLNLQTNSCEIDLDQLLTIPFCIKQSGIQCIQCENLYYIYFNYCMPIFDPDCESSNGIKAFCNLCKNGQLLGKYNNNMYSSSETICNSILCKSTDPLTGDCIECHFGKVLIQSRNTDTQKLVCAQKRPKCAEQNNEGNCVQCEVGYYKDDDQSQNICLKIFIDNCITMDIKRKRCSQCKIGYDLLDSGLCFKLTRCLRFENFICKECTAEFYLKDGVCLQIKNCIKQNYRQCLRCASKYWLISKRASQQSSKVSGSSMNSQADDNYEDSQDGFVSSKYIDSCQRIPNCAESDGQTDSCILCQRGFNLRMGICISENNERDQLERRTTTVNHCVVYDEASQCIKCQNLFFLVNFNCVQMAESSRCQQNNGINDDCQVCSQHGFVLAFDYIKQQSFCINIENCSISNGIDSCIVCEENHVINNHGQCDQFLAQGSILNCLELSYEKIINLKSLQADNNASNIPNNVTLDCQRCNNLFYLSSDQQECLQLSPNSLSNCSFSNGKLDDCAICEQGFNIRSQNVVDQGPSPSCYRQSKKTYKRVQNQGCQIFFQQQFILCFKCLDGFFLTSKNGECHPRSEYFLRKCLRFNPIEDECEICASGFKMKEFRSMNRTMKICLKLDVREEIENCTEYSPGTNKCIQCIKRYQYDVIEYVLDEDKNRCIDVLHLMCRTIDRTKLACIDHFIPNCEKTVSFKCIQCDNGFYLSKREKGYEMPQQLSESISCIKHALIRNCQIYSQEQQDTCDFCEPYFSLVTDNNQDQCVAITLSHCKHAKGTTCIQCEDSRFGLDKNTGTCVENQIVKCLEFTQDRISNTQVCLKCQRNYILSNNKTECIWRLPEMNCKNSISLSEENQVCQECKEGYFLNINGDCLRINSFCRIANCLEYSKEQSVADSMICKQCISNYALEEQSQICLPLDPQSNINNEIQENLHGNNSNSKNSSKDEIKQEQQDSFSHFILLVVCLAIVVALICLIYQIIRILKSQRSSNHEDCQVEKVIFKHTKEFHIDVNIEIPDVESVKNQSKDANHNEEDSSMSFVNQNEWIS